MTKLRWFLLIVVVVVVVVVVVEIVLLLVVIITCRFILHLFNNSDNVKLLFIIC